MHRDQVDRPESSHCLCGLGPFWVGRFSHQLTWKCGRAQNPVERLLCSWKGPCCTSMLVGGRVFWLTMVSVFGDPHGKRALFLWLTVRLLPGMPPREGLCEYDYPFATIMKVDTGRFQEYSSRPNASCPLPLLEVHLGKMTHGPQHRQQSLISEWVLFQRAY